MGEYSIFELKCPSCNLQYSQMISEKEYHLPVLCPSCGDNLEKVGKVSGAELLTSCGYKFSGS